MKKLIAILVSAVLLVTSILSASMFTVSADDTVTETVVTDTARLAYWENLVGEEVQLFASSKSAIPTNIADPNWTLTENTTKLPLTSLFKLTMPEGKTSIADEIRFSEEIDPNEVKGAIFYVEIPDFGTVSHTYDQGTEDTSDDENFETDQFRFAFHFYGYDYLRDTDDADQDGDTTEYLYNEDGSIKTKHHGFMTYGGTDWYIRGVNDTDWTKSGSKTYYGISLDSGFKGYVCVPFNALTQEGLAVSADSRITTFVPRQIRSTTDVFYSSTNSGTYYGYLPVGESLVISEPIWMKGDFADGADEFVLSTSATSDSLVIDGAEYNYNTGKVREVSYPDASGLTGVMQSEYSSTGAYISTDTTYKAALNTAYGTRTAIPSISSLTDSDSVLTNSFRHYNASTTTGNHAAMFQFPEGSTLPDAGYLVYAYLPSVEGDHTIYSERYTYAGAYTNCAQITSSTFVWYSLAKNSTSWTEHAGTKSAYVLDFNDADATTGTSAAWEGWIYIPRDFWRNTTTSTAVEMLSLNPETYRKSTASQSGISGWKFSGMTAIKSFDTSLTKVVGDDNRVVDLTTNTIIDTNYTEPKEFVGNTELIDYGNANIIEMNAMTPRELPLVGNTVSSTLFDAGEIVSGATYAANPSPISEMPLFSVAGTVGDTATTQGVQMTISSNVATSTTVVNCDDIDGFMFYVKNGTNPAPIHLGAATMISSDGVTYTTKYSQYNSGKTYLLAKNSNEWTTAAAEGLSNMKLIPANFEGWVYVPKFANMTSQYTKVWRFNIFMATTADDKTVDLDFGSFMTVKAGTWTEENAGVAFVNGAAVAQNMWTGDFTLVGDENKDFRVDLVDLCYLGANVKDYEADFTYTSSISTDLTNTKVANTTSMPFDTLYKVTGTGTATYVTLPVEEATKGKGVIFYIEAPDSEAEDYVRVNIYHSGGTTFRYGYANYYHLAEGDTNWVGKTMSHYGPNVDNFKGYIYVPFYLLNQGQLLDADSTVTSIGIEITNAADYVISAPIVVKGDITDTTLPDATALSSGTKEYSFFGENAYDPSTDAEEYSIKYIYDYKDFYFANFEPTMSAQFNVTMSVAPLAYSADDATTVLSENPDRGYRTELFCQLAESPLTIAETPDYTVSVDGTDYTVTVTGNELSDGTLDTDYNIANADMYPFGVGSGGAVHTVPVAAAKAYATANSLASDTDSDLINAAITMVDNYMQYDYRPYDYTSSPNTQTGMTNIDVAALNTPIYSGTAFDHYEAAHVYVDDALSEIKLLVSHGRRTIFASDSEDEWRARWTHMFNVIYKIGQNIEVTGTDADGNTVYYNITNNLFNAYLQFTEFAYKADADGNTTPIPDSVMTALDFFFDFCREKGVKCNFRPAYNADYTKNAYLNQAVSTYVDYRNQVASQCADEATMIAHIKQMAPIIAENKDVIHKISSGWIGFGGEMAGVYQYPPVSYKNVITALLDEHCIPNDLYFSSRSSSYVYNAIEGVETNENYNNGLGYGNLDMFGLEADAEWGEKYADWCGFNNDAFFGEQTFEDWYSGGGVLNPTSEAWQKDTANAAYAPVDGELFVNSAHVYNIENVDGVYHWYGEDLAKTTYDDTDNKIPTGLEAILQLAHHRYVDLSQWHGFLDARNSISVMGLWMDQGAEWVFEGDYDGLNGEDQFNAVERAEAIKALITSEVLDANGIVYDPAYFENNESVNAYEFIRDHLGYRIVAEEVSVDFDGSKSDKVSVSVDLKNYGFAAAFNMESSLAILDANGNVVQQIAVGDPSTWYSVAPDYYTVERTSSALDDVLTHTLTAAFDEITVIGEYYVALKLSNTAGTSARLANDIEMNEQGYNILGSFYATVAAH